MGLVYLQRYTTEKGTLVACCDEKILGKTFREGKLKLTVEPKFFGKTVIALEEAVTILALAEMMNLVGHDIVSAAIDQGFVHPDAVIQIGGIPHVQVLKM
jgi:hypothetical protein